jgi:cytoskeleton protein RodZ
MVQETETARDQRSPGDVLRAARESAGLSIEQVAEKLHLLQSIVSSLETDCYDRIRGETFVKGYMRNYARLLGISDDDVVGRYKDKRGTGTKSEQRSARKRDSSWHGSSGAGRVGVVLALLTLSAYFFLSHRDRVESLPSPVSAVVTVETEQGALALPTLDNAPLGSPVVPARR